MEGFGELDGSDLEPLFAIKKNMDIFIPVGAHNELEFTVEETIRGQEVDRDSLEAEEEYMVTKVTVPAPFNLRYYSLAASASSQELVHLESSLHKFGEDRFP